MSTQLVSMHSLVPNAKDLLVLSAPELAFELLSCLMSLREDDLNLYNLNLRDEFTRNYPPQFEQEIESAVSGSWSWLLGQGYLGQRADSSNSGFVTITPHGRRWHEEQRLRRESAQDSEPSDARAPATDLSLDRFGFAEYSGAPVDEELFFFLGQVLELGTSDRDFDFTFSSILATFLYAKDPTLGMVSGICDRSRRLPRCDRQPSQA